MASEAVGGNINMHADTREIKGRRESAITDSDITESAITNQL